MNSAVVRPTTGSVLLRRERRSLVCAPAVALALLLCRTPASAQVISDFSPKAGTPGDTIQVTGSGFSVGTIRIYFWNGVAATTRVTSDTMLTATVPQGATTGVLGVQRNTGQPIYTSTSFTLIGSGPYISDFSPSFGSPGALVVINGTHFLGVAPNGVKFNGIASTDANPSANGLQVSVHVPAGTPVGAAPFVVTTPAGSSNSPAPFNVLGPGPYVSGFDPDHFTGQPISIYGVHFTVATNALFNGVPGLNFSRSETLITVTPPAGVITGPLTVNSSAGTFRTSSNFFGVPVISRFSPSRGRTGTNVTITGSNFRGATAVRFNGQGASFEVINNTNIQATVPTGATSGLIQVVTPDFSSVTSSNFTVPPTIYGFSPTWGRPGTNVVITGANLNVGTANPAFGVWFNGVKASSVSGISFGQLTAVVPAGATTTGPISISTTDGSHTNANPFYLPGIVTSFTPDRGLPGSTVSFTGRNFLGATSVSFNGVPAAFFTVWSNTSLTATVPNNAISGPITVRTPAGTFATSSSFYGAPRIDSFSPTGGLPGTNVTLIGTNFLDATAVRFNGLNASFNYINNGRIVAVVPPNAHTGEITIEAPGGTNASLGNFTVDYQSNLETWITDAPDPVTATSNLVYSVTVINRGPFEAPHVRLTNTLPSSVVLVSATMPPPWSVVTNDHQVTATIDNVAVGGTSTMTIQVVPQVAGTIIAGAGVASDRTDPLPGNNNVAITTFVVPLPTLAIDWWTNRFKVSWHAALTNFVLQSAVNSLSNAVWSSVTNIPVISGTQQFVVESNTTPSKYYRLKK